MTEEKVTKTILIWLKNNGWNVESVQKSVCQDF